MNISVLSRRILLLLGILLLFGMNQAFAQRPDSGSGKAIRDKLQQVVDKTDALNTTLESLCDLNCQNTPAGQRFKQKVERIKKAHGRVKIAHGRSHEEDFQEVIRYRGRKKDEGCDPQMQVCMSSSSSSSLLATSTEPEFDEERGKDVIEDLDEVASDVDELNALLAGNVPPLPPTPDVQLENASYFFPASMWPSSEVSFGAFLANLAGEKAAAIADHFCDQTAVALGFGGNGSAACSIVEGVHQVLDAIYQMLDYISQDVTAAEVNGAYRRAKNIFDQLVFTDNGVDNTRAVVEAMGKKLLELEENQKLILRLLQMPQGQRESFPKP